MHHEELRRAFCDNDAGLLRKVLRDIPDLRSKINEPLGPFDSPLVLSARSPEILEALLEAGADINARSRWWAGSFGLLDSADENLARYAIGRGAKLDAHAAARLGWMPELRELLRADPGLVHARGGDGQTPLHFAKTVEVAALLLEQGADINARDIDHESTPVQYMIGDRQEVARFLVARGAETDLFAGAALGDADLVRRHLAARPEDIRLRVDEKAFPMKNRHAGGTIYNWTLGFHLSPHQVARKFGHEAVFNLLMERSPLEIQLLNWCWMGDTAAVESLLKAEPGLAERLGEEKNDLAHAARNNNAAAVQLMLAAGFPVFCRGQHRATPLHWAAWHGNLEMVKALLAKGAPLEDSANDFEGTPLDWAMHGSENGWFRDGGNYIGTVQALLAAGAKVPKTIRGTAAVQEAVRMGRVPGNGAA